MLVAEEARGTPDVERLAAEGSFGLLVRHFASREDAFRFLSGRQSVRFSFDHAGGHCLGCGSGADGGVVEALWDYRYPSVAATLVEAFGAFGHVHADRHRHDSFLTYHAACRSCMRRWRLRRAAAAGVLAVGIMGIAFGGSMSVLSLIFYFGGTFSPADRRDLRFYLVYLVVAAVAGAFLWVVGNHWRTPAPLRRVARRPVDLKRMRHRPADEWRSIFAESEEGYEAEDD